MNNAISIEKRVAGTSGRYVGRIDGVGGKAELHFTMRSPKLISADHTEAPASMRGRARRLMARMLAKTVATAATPPRP